MANLTDPAWAQVLRELRIFRKGAGQPTAARLTGLLYLTEALGEGVPQRAFDEFTRLQETVGTDPTTDIGAYFYLSGYGVGLDSVDQRRAAYRDEYFADVSTAWRRSERGIAQLVTLIRDRDEQHRPWAFVSLFQSGDRVQPVLDFNLARESWRVPQVFINDDSATIDFHVHESAVQPGWVTRRIILPETPLDLTAGFGERMAAIRVVWAMPIWPVWSLFSWTADPRVTTHMRTFRERAVEVSIQWSRHQPAAEAEALVTDGAIWTERTNLDAVNLPRGWSGGVRTTLSPSYRDSGHAAPTESGAGADG